LAFWDMCLTCLEGSEHTGLSLLAQMRAEPNYPE